jgi:protein-tyrosine-phosphatase
MAEGFARHHFCDTVEVYSAGSNPAGAVAPLTTTVMAEKGIDISGRYPKSLSEVPQGPYDIVVTMGCGDACPWIPATHRMDWNIEDPIGGDIATYRAVRDTIDAKVKALSNLVLAPA